MNIEQLYHVLTESFNNGYNWSRASSSSSSEVYYIDLPNGEEIAVTVAKDKKEKFPVVEFTPTNPDPSDIFAMNGQFAKEGMNPIRVFSSIVEIMKQSTLIKTAGGFTMYSKKSERSRTSLYIKMLGRFGFKSKNLRDMGQSIGFDVEL